MKKIILLSLIACACIFAKNTKNDTFCEDIGTTLVQELNECVIDDTIDDHVVYDCANGQFGISKTGEYYFVIVIRDTLTFKLFYLTGVSTKRSFCAVEHYDELGILTVNGKTPMRYEHKFDVYNEFKKRFIIKN